MEADFTIQEELAGKKTYPHPGLFPNQRADLEEGELRVFMYTLTIWSIAVVYLMNAILGFAWAVAVVIGR
jgi:hypothetical protein